MQKLIEYVSNERGMDFDYSKHRNDLLEKHKALMDK